MLQGLRCKQVEESESEENDTTGALEWTKKWSGGKRKKAREVIHTQPIALRSSDARRKREKRRYFEWKPTLGNWDILSLKIHIPYTYIATDLDRN